MNIKAIIETLQNNLEGHLKGQLPNHSISEVYEYACLPPGKLFRPLLVAAVAYDYSDHSMNEVIDQNSKFSKIASAMEVHHSYTLVHDDMPCMDDDDERRGKPSTHKQFGEWKALLAGDALLNISYQLLAKSKVKNLQDLLTLMSWSLGPRGLIHGQVMDLGHEMTEDFSSLIRTHELKTGRLIQLSLLSGLIALDDNEYIGENRFKDYKGLFKLGRALGVVFQLLDDLTELVDEELSQHEEDVNPWPRFTNQCLKELNKDLDSIIKVLREKENLALKAVLGAYFGKIHKILEGNEKIVEGHIAAPQFRLGPIMLMLNRLTNL